jgi:hypothetical protein
MRSAFLEQNGGLRGVSPEEEGRDDDVVMLLMTRIA